MKKMICFCLILAGMCIANPVIAQNDEFRKEWSTETREVIGSISSLKNLSDEVAMYMVKIEGKKAEFINADADTKALMDKYAKELENQILVYKNDTKVYPILKNELDRIKREYLTSK